MLTGCFHSTKHYLAHSIQYTINKSYWKHSMKTTLLLWELSYAAWIKCRLNLYCGSYKLIVSYHVWLVCGKYLKIPEKIIHDSSELGMCILERLEGIVSVSV